MSFHLSRAALDRPKQTIHACELLHAHAPVVVSACSQISSDYVVVAVIDRADMVFAGTWKVPAVDLARRVPELEDGGWAFTFSPGTRIQDIEQRALVTARLAFGRWEAMQRWASRNR